MGFGLLKAARLSRILGGVLTVLRLKRGSQTLREQHNEVHVFALLGATRIAMLWFANAVENLKNELGQGGGRRWRDTR